MPAGKRRVGAWLLALLLLAPFAVAAANPRLAAAAEAQVGVTVHYDPAYVRLDFPGGDVPADRGVCTDVVVRALRAAAGADLQALVHRDMREAFAAYPRQWGLRGPDRNIDHRRVPNLETFLQRRGLALPRSDDPADYRAGDIVSWRLSNGLPHIGIVARRRGAHGRPLVVHNIGAGARIEDVLFAWPVQGHYRWPAPAP